MENVGEKDTSTLLSETPLPPVALPDGEKIGLYLDAAVEKAKDINPKLATALAVAKPFIILPIRVILCLGPLYVWLFTLMYKIYMILPTNIIQAIVGLALCFFGGTYVISIAAIEAFRQMGWKTLFEEMKIVWAQVQNVREENRKDDLEDKDRNGVADVAEISASELAQRKVILIMRSITEPGRLQTACGALWAAYIAVLATLRLEFARTTAFALGIVEIAKFPVVRLLSPLILAVLAKDLTPQAAKDWSVTIVESALTLIAVAFAWYLQMIISAFYSGLRGGRLFADAICNILIERGWMEKLPCVAKPFKQEDTHLDEVICYLIAAAGFCFQIFSGFALPFPINLIFFPLTVLEWFLRIQVTITSEPL